MQTIISRLPIFPSFLFGFLLAGLCGFTVLSPLPLVAQEQTTTLAEAHALFAEADALFKKNTKADREAALQKYGAAAGLFHAARFKRGEAKCLSQQGLILADLGKNSQALPLLQSALTLFREVPDEPNEADVLTTIGTVYSDLGDKTKAQEYFLQALQLEQKLGNQVRQTTLLTNLGLTYAAQGETGKAVGYYQEALQLNQKTANPQTQAHLLHSLADVYFASGENQKALDHYQQALRLWQETQDTRAEASTLTAMGLLYTLFGESQKALTTFQMALKFQQEIGDKRGEAITRQRIGSVFLNLRDGEQAARNYQPALDLARQSGDQSLQAQILNNLGAAELVRGAYPQAVPLLEQALEIRRAIKDKTGEAQTLNNLGQVFLKSGDLNLADDYYQQALKMVREAENRSFETRILKNIGEIQYRQKKLTSAALTFQAGLRLARSNGDRMMEFFHRCWLARVVRDQQDLSEAKNQLELALPLAEFVRSATANQELRASFFAHVRDIYEMYVDILVRLHRQLPERGYVAVALTASEQARAKSLADQLRERELDLTADGPVELVKREQELKELIKAKQELVTRLLLRKQPSQRIEVAQRECAVLLDEYRQVQATLRSRHPRYAHLTAPEPLPVTTIQQRLLDSDTMLLEFMLGKETSYVWAVTQTTVKVFDLPGKAQLEQLARQFHQQVSAPQRAARNLVKVSPAATSGHSKELQNSLVALSQALLGPIGPELTGKRLVIVPDGALFYVPFGTLLLPPGSNPAGLTADTQTRLIDHYEISVVPSMTLVPLLRQQPEQTEPEKVLAVLADPVFYPTEKRKPGDSTPAIPTTGSPVEASSRTSWVLTRLPYTRREADNISGFVPKENTLKALGLDANRGTVLSGKLNQYRYVHFATHGLVDVEQPEFSALALSMVDSQGHPQDGFLRLIDTYHLHLKAELVTLSACETGLGKEIAGEGLVGLTGGFFYAGSKRVVVSLWKVNDRATAELMTEFYRGIFVKKMAPAAALQEAQLYLKKQKKWSAPYFWAAFQLQGEWK